MYSINLSEVASALLDFSTGRALKLGFYDFLLGKIVFLLIRMFFFRIVLIKIYLLVQESNLSDIAMEFYEAKYA